MESEFRFKPPRGDPDRWKPYTRLGLLVPLVALLGLIEFQLLEGILRFGAMRDLVPAIIFGALLVWMLYVLGLGFWRALNPIAPEVLLAAAKSTLDHQLAAQEFVSRSRVRTSPNGLLYAALPATFLLLAVFGAWIDRLPMFFTMLAAAAVMGGLMFYIFTTERQRRTLVVTFDPVHRRIVFEHAAFVSSFRPAKPSIRTELPFADILGSDFYPGHRGPAALHIRTTKGSVQLTDQHEEFERIRAIVDSIVILNKSDRDAYQQKLDAEPEIKTPWYGWLILLAVIAGVVFLGWKFMYSDY